MAAKQLQFSKVLVSSLKYLQPLVVQAKKSLPAKDNKWQLEELL